MKVCKNCGHIELSIQETLIHLLLLEKGTMSTNEIANKMNISRRHAGIILTRLEKNNLIQRKYKKNKMLYWG